MSNYTQTTFFGPKDNLPLGNPAKFILGTDVDTELENIATAISTKYDATNIPGVSIPFGNGSVGAPSITFNADSTTGFYRSAAETIGVAVNGSQLASLSSAGLALLSGSFSGSGANLTSIPNAALINSGVTVIAGVGLSGGGSVSLGSSVTLNIGQSVAPSATPTFATLTTTSPLSIFAGTAGSPALRLSVPSNASDGALQIFDSTNSAVRAFIGGGSTITGQATTDLAIAPGTGGNVLIGHANGTGIGTSFGPNGNVVISTPSSGVGLTVNGVTGSFAAAIQGTASGGLFISGGDSSANNALTVFNDTQSTNLLAVHGDGGITVGNPAGGDEGAGTLNAAGGLFLDGVPAGYRGTPVNVQTGSYTLIASDSGKLITESTSGTTITVPNGVMSPGDVVTIRTSFTAGSLTIAQGTGLTLYWGNGSGNTTGNRTLTAVGIATLLFDSSSSCTVVGSSLS